MTVEEWLKRGIVNRGDWTRLKRCMKKAETGEMLNIGFLGGSITQGSLASSPEKCYAWLTYQWWVGRFRNAKHHYINGGIGGTSSHFGVVRAWTDVLQYRPDVVFVDFSVNDDANEFYEETYEGVIRKLLKAPGNPAVVILNNVFYDDGHNAETYHNKIGAAYGIPCVSMKAAVYPMIADGLYTATELTQDNLHPNDLGHAYVAGALIDLLEQVYASKDEINAKPAVAADMSKQETVGMETAGVLPVPLTANAYENSRRYQIGDGGYRMQGFTVDTDEKKGMLDLYKNGWMGRRLGDGIVFELTCSCLAVQYKKAVNKPVPKAVAVIDGDEAHQVLLDGNFDEDWGDCLYIESLMHHGEMKMHRLEIRVCETHENDTEPFYLVSVIAA